MILEVILIAFESLKANKLRTFLSMLGIVIGVGAVVAIVSIGTGAQHQVAGEIAGLGSNLINIMPRITDDREDVRKDFTLQLGQYIEELCPDVKRVVPSLQSSVLVSVGATEANLTLVATTLGYANINNYSTYAGQFIQDNDVHYGRNVIVLGWEAARDLFNGKNPLENTVTLSYSGRDLVFEVVGVMEEKGQGLIGNFDDQVYIPVTTYMQRMRRRDYVDSYLAQAVSSERANNAVGQIRHFLTGYLGSSDSFRLLSQDQILDVINQVIGTLNLMLGGIAAISLLVGGIGIMNIMLVSVTERTREIGIRKALGAKKRNIMMQFLIEASTLSGIGGIIGICLGYLGASIISNIGDWPLVVLPSSVAIAFGFSLFVGLFFGIYPAMKAAGLDPVDALSYE